LYKNVISELLEIDSNDNWLYFTRQPAIIRVQTGTEVFCIGINNEGSERKIKGGNVALWYGDEVTTYAKLPTEMCLSRCRREIDGTLKQMPSIWTTNPDDPAHFIKIDYIDKKDLLNMHYYQFGFNDNPIIDDVYVNEQKKLYSGIFYDRMIMGKWVGDTEKKVIPEFTEDKEKDIVKEVNRPEYYDTYGALDPAFEDNTGYVLGYYDFLDAKYCIDNELLLSKKNTDIVAQNIKDIETQTFGTKKMYLRVSDTESQVICDLVELHDLMIVATKKDDLHAQVNYLRVLVQNNKLIINPRCVNLIWQLKTCLWDNNRKQFMRNEKDRHYDLVAALIYFVRNVDIHRNPYPDLPSHITEDKYFISEIKKKGHELEKVFT
jgi:PBSX family phage terminase large subunit